MARPNSRQSLIEYCLRQLGAPVIEINVADEQLDDCTDDALQFYQEYHSDSTIKMFRKHQLTEQDVQNKWIPLPESILFVSRILPIVTVTQSSASNLFSLNYQIALNTMHDFHRQLDMVTYEMTRQHMNMIDATLNGLNEITYFNRHMGRLYLKVDWAGSEVRVGDYIVIECYELVDPEEHNRVYNDLYLKRYLTAKIKKQWGQNIKKYDGMQLPGGVTISGQAIYDEAEAEIVKLEEEMELKWSTPPTFFVG